MRRNTQENIFSTRKKWRRDNLFPIQKEHIQLLKLTINGIFLKQMILKAMTFMKNRGKVF
jgi:hypothetical protein